MSTTDTPIVTPPEDRTDWVYSPECARELGEAIEDVTAGRVRRFGNVEELIEELKP